MSTNLIELPAGAQPEDHNIALAPPTSLTPEQIADLIGPWLPRVQLFSSNAGPVKERIFPAGHWGIPVSPSTIVDLGEEVDVVLVATRQRAMQWDGETMTTSCDRESSVFQEIIRLSETDKDSGAMYGPEFLAWVGSQQMFATLFLGSPSARRETLMFMQAINKPGQLYSKLVGRVRRWEIPQVRVTSAFPFDLPAATTTKKAWEKFTKVEETEAEPVATDQANSRAR